MKQFFISIRDFILRNLGLLIVVGGYLVPLAIFIIGIRLEEDTWSPDALGISNRTLLWVISIPFWTLMLTFIGQAIYYRMDTHREIKELKESYEKRFREIKNYSALFSIIDDVNNKDIYSSTIFSFLIEKMKKDIDAIKDGNFIADGWYWKISNKFILHEKNALCSCVLTPKQLSETDIHEYFEEQYKAINDSNKKFQLERVLIVDSLSHLKGYSGFISEQLNRGVNIFILAKEFAELSALTPEIWENDFKRDFALIDDNFMIEAKIVNQDLKGYEIRRINGVVPLFVQNVRQYMKPVTAMVDFFANESYNPVKEILNAKSK